MNDGAKSGPRDNPQDERETAILNLSKLAPAFRISCGNEVPRPEDIRSFRKLNRQAIQKTLEKVLRFARAKVAETLSPSNPFRGEATRSTTPPVVAQSDEAQTIARREASDPLDKATFTDGMSM